MKKYSKTLFCPLFCFLYAGAANAALVVSNLNEASAGSGGNPLMAMAFTTDSSSYTLNNIVAPLGEINFSGSLNVTGSLYNDVGSLPGVLLSNGDLGTVTIDGFSTIDRTFSPSGGTINLNANTTYWFVLDSSSVNGLLWKDTSSTNEDSPGASNWTISDNRAFFNTTSSSWETSPTIHMFSVDATVSSVPVPAAVWLFGSGLLGLIGISRRKKSA